MEQKQISGENEAISTVRRVYPLALCEVNERGSGVYIDALSGIIIGSSDVSEALAWQDAATRTVNEPARFGKIRAGADLIAAERQRQIAVKGWTAERDDEYLMGELIAAALTYSDRALNQVSGGDILEDAPEVTWPWDDARWKPSDDPIRNLVKAGALIAAEIDRLQRAEAAKSLDEASC